MALTQLLPNLYNPFLGKTGPFAGVPLNGGKLFTYIAGTTTPQATYTDNSGLTPNTNPVILNSAGYASVWVSAAAYKFVLQDSLGNVQWTIDSVSYINPGSIGSAQLASDIAGIALNLDPEGQLDVQVDNSTMQVNGSNQLAVKTIAASNIATASKLEVLIKNVRDLTCPGLYQSIPQYEWTTPSKISSPTPSGAANVARWSPNGEFLAVGHATASYLNIYQRSGSTLTLLSGFSSGLSAAVSDISWSPCGDFIAAGGSNKSFGIYNRIGNQFVSVPVDLTATLNGSSWHTNSIKFSPNSDFLTVSGFGTSSGNVVVVLQRGGSASVEINATDSAPVTGTADLGTGVVTGTAAVTISATSNVVGNGTTFTDITTTSTLTGVGSVTAWSPDSSLFGALNNSTGAIDFFSRADNVFTGTTAPSVSSYLTFITDMSFSPDGNYFAVALDITPFILIFSTANGIYTPLANPGTLPPGDASTLAWSANSEYLLVGDSSSTSPYMTIYSMVTGAPVKQANPTSLPVGAIVGGDWTQTKQFLALATNTTPYIQLYETASVLPSNAMLWTREAPNV